MARYRLLIADDEKIIREGLATSVDWSALGFCVTGVFSGGNAVIEYLRDHTADVLFTDVVMQDGSGLDAAEWINAYRPDMKVILLTGYADFEAARRAIECRVVQHMIMKPTQVSEIRHVVSEVLGELLLRDAHDVPGQAPAATGDDPLMRKVCEYMRAHLSRGVTLGEAARIAHFTPSYLSRIIKERTGKTFTELQVEFRMEEARRLLEQTQKKVEEIGRLVGYGDVRHFTKVFRQCAGMTPSEFRRRLL